MDPTDLVDGVLRSVLGGRRKPSRRTARYLARGTSGVARAALSNPTALLTLAGVAWGVIESLQNRNGSGGGASGSDAGGGGAQGLSSAGVGGGAMPVGTGAGSGGATAGGGATGVPLPPLPTVVGSTQATPVDAATRLVRLAISVAQADGAMTEVERAAVLEQARAAGVEEAVAQELAAPRPLREIVAGVTDAGQRATLYGLAFSIARADESVSGAERIYLAQLANLLSLDPAAVQTLERGVESRIDSADA